MASSDIVQAGREKSMAGDDGQTDPDDISHTKDRPNGGTKAWLQVVGSFVLFFNTWGLLNTFGVYQEYYASGQLFQTTASDISWIGSLQAFLMFLVGCITGPLFDAGHLRFLLVLGTFGVVFGHMMLSLVSTYWQALLAQAVVIGLGAGCLFLPSVAVSPQYFDTRLVTATGLGAAGSSFGGIIYPIMFNRLLEEVGFQWAVRIIGFFALALLVVPLLTMEMRTLPSAKRPLFDKSAFTDKAFVTFMISGFFGYIGLNIPFFYIPSIAKTDGLAGESASFYLLPILNAASVFGRTIPSMLADRVGPLNMLIPTAAISAIIAYCIIAVKNYAGMAVAAVFYGFWSGAYVSLPFAMFSTLTPPEKKHLLGTRMGFGLALMGIGLLIGTPVAGVISGPSNNFPGLLVWAGTTLATACAGFVLVRLLRVGPIFMAKI